MKEHSSWLIPLQGGGGESGQGQGGRWQMHRGYAVAGP